MMGRTRHLGIEIGERTLKAAQLGGSRNHLQLEAWALVDRERPNFDGERWDPGMFMDMNLAFQNQGLSRGPVSVALPDRLVNISYRKLPPMPREELGEALLWELRKDTPVSPDDVVLDSLDLGETLEGSTRLRAHLVALVSRRTVLDLCKGLASLRLRPVGLEVSTLAQAALMRGVGVQEGTVALVDLGGGQSSILILSRGEVRFFRPVSLGGDSMSEAVAQATGLSRWEAERIKTVGLESAVGDPEVSRALRKVLEAIADEVYQTFHFYLAERREGPVERVVLSGGVSQMRGVDRLFHEALGMPVDLMDPFTRVRPARGLRDPDKALAQRGRMAAPLGLALRE